MNIFLCNSSKAFRNVKNFSGSALNNKSSSFTVFAPLSTSNIGNVSWIASLRASSCASLNNLHKYPSNSNSTLLGTRNGFSNLNNNQFIRYSSLLSSRSSAISVGKRNFGVRSWQGNSIANYDNNQRYGGSGPLQRITDPINQLPSDYLLYAIIALNIAIFGIWNTYGQSREGKQFMFDNFTTSMNNLVHGRIWTPITSCFSQMGFWHVAANSIVLYYIGGNMINVLGNTRFLMVYLLGGLCSSGLHIAYENYLKPQPKYRRVRETPALGASGSIMALIVMYGLTFPREIIYLNFFLPVPAIVLAGGYVAWDFYNAVINSHDGTSHAGHLGGALFGGLYWAARYARTIR